MRNVLQPLSRGLGCGLREVVAFEALDVEIKSDAAD